MRGGDASVKPAFNPLYPEPPTTRSKTFDEQQSTDCRRNQVAAEFEIEFEVPDTGRRVRDQEIHLWTFDDHGQVTRLRHYADTAKHIAALQG